ncbi:MAG TPA: trypsin-like peptidase domain-containing protein [Abditibacteriaceae bacterium]|jgi:S1-C subfamily serine protease
MPRLLKISCWFFALYLITGFFGHPLPAGAQTPVIERAKQATALVELPDGEGFGSAFCITPDGIFVTNQHVVEGVPIGGKVSLVLSAGLRTEKILEAKVLRVDEENDIALLHAASRTALTPLSLASAANLTETQPVAAIGFPFGTDLALEEGQYPSATVTIGRITALRRAQGELHDIQIDAAVNPGNSGGPLINEQGQVVGIVYAGIRGAEGVNFAISVGLLQKVLKAPIIVFQPPAKLPDDKHHESEFGIRVVPILGNAAPYTVQLSLSAARGDQRTFLAQNKGDNQYVARAALLPANVPQSNLISFVVTVRQGAETVGESKGAIELNRAAPAAGTGWLGGAAAPGAKAGALGSPQPQDSNTPALRDTQAIDDLHVSAFTFPTNETVSSMQWSGDGKRLYLLSKNGMLRRIAVPEFREEKTLNLGQTCSALAMSQLGLVVGLPQIHQVWLLDATTLAVLKRIPAAGVEGLASSPALTTAYATSKEMLTIVDLAEGKAAAQLTPRAAQRAGGRVKRSPDATPLFNFRLPSVTPDGRYFFCVSDESYDGIYGSLHRFRINQNELIYEEIGPTIGKNPQRIEVSDDSSYVAMPSGGGNTDRGYTTHVYAVTDLATPVVSLESGANPRALGFDRVASKIYAQDSTNQLVVFTPTGIKEKTYHLLKEVKYSALDVQTNQFLVHPLGNRVLVATGSQLIWVELPGAGAARRPLAATPGPLIPAPATAPAGRPGEFGAPLRPSSGAFGGGGNGFSAPDATTPAVAAPNAGVPNRAVETAPKATFIKGTVSVKITVDGIDYLHLKGNEAWISHQTWEKPGASVVINEKPWLLEWDGNMTKKYTGLEPSLSVFNSGSITLNIENTSKDGRVRIVKYPTSANYEVVILLSDAAQAGAHEMSFKLHWTVEQQMPTRPNTN